MKYIFLYWWEICSVDILLFVYSSVYLYLRSQFLTVASKTAADVWIYWKFLTWLCFTFPVLILCNAWNIGLVNIWLFKEHYTMLGRRGYTRKRWKPGSLPEPGGERHSVITPVQTLGPQRAGHYSPCSLSCRLLLASVENHKSLSWAPDPIVSLGTGGLQGL